MSKIYKNLWWDNYLKIEIYYSKWGMNYFHWSNDPRGIYISIRNVERIQRNWYTSESFSMMWGKWEGRMLLLEMWRANNKTLDSFVNILQSNEEKIFELYEWWQIELIKELFL
jgi:hypothetical protein